VSDGCEISRLNREGPLVTARLEGSRGAWNSGWSGEMRRDPEEHQRRRRRAGLQLTLNHESQGSERD
jgi:hypothetical protein